MIKNAILSLVFLILGIFIVTVAFLHIDVRYQEYKANNLCEEVPKYKTPAELEKRLTTQNLKFIKTQEEQATTYMVIFKTKSISRYTCVIGFDHGVQSYTDVVFSD